MPHQLNEEIEMMIAKSGDGDTIEVGDVVGFKYDIEQYGVVKAIRRKQYGSGHLVVMTPASECWDGEYLTHQPETHVEDADRCWVD